MQFLASGVVETILLVLSIPLLVILVVGLLGLAALRMLLGAGRYRQSAEESTEEARMIQDIYHGLQRMEQRVNALETILLEREKKG